MGSSMSLRSRDICIQLQNRRHWRQAVESLLKTVAEKPVWQVSEIRRGVCHIVVLYQDVSYRGVDVLLP